MAAAAVASSRQPTINNVLDFSKPWALIPKKERQRFLTSLTKTEPNTKEQDQYDLMLKWLSCPCEVCKSKTLRLDDCKNAYDKCFMNLYGTKRQEVQQPHPINELLSLQNSNRNRIASLALPMHHHNNIPTNIPVRVPVPVPVHVSSYMYHNEQTLPTLDSPIYHNNTDNDFNNGIPEPPRLPGTRSPYASLFNDEQQMSNWPASSEDNHMDLQSEI